MYGYIKPNNSELKVREHLYYKSMYCGLCRSLSKHTGGFSSITLSYDMTFFALARIVLTKEKPVIKKRNCILHPFSKRPIMCDSEALEYTSYVSGVLFHHKVKDNIKDESFFKKIGYYIIYPLSAYIKHRNKVKPINDIVKTHMDSILAKEKELCPNPDSIANDFANMMGALLSYDLQGNESRIAYEIGYHTGRWLYLSDALCDYEEDKKEKRYNPFIYSFDNESEQKAFFDSGYKIVLNHELEMIISSLDLLEYEDDELRECAYNIASQGMKYNFEYLFKNNQKKGENISEQSI